MTREFRPVRFFVLMAVAAFVVYRVTRFLPLSCDLRLGSTAA
jgi:hypothetical protein